MAFLEFVNDEAFLSEVKLLLTKAINKRIFAEKTFNSNVIDPFGALFEASGFHNHEQWRRSEITRQCQKTIQNHVGTFHQRLLGHVVGWENMGTGGIVDLHNPAQKIIAEIKNKYSTVTGGDLASKYYSLEDLISPKHSRFKGYCAYFVNIIPKYPTRKNDPFTPSDKEKGSRCTSNENIRIIDGASFYELVTGRQYALRELHSALPEAIEYIYRNDFKKSDFSNTDCAKFMQYFELAYGE